MNSNNEQLIDQLKLKLELLSRKQNSLSIEIEELRNELVEIVQHDNDVVINSEENVSASIDSDNEVVVERQVDKQILQTEKKELVSKTKQTVRPTLNIDWEKFIGENLANKIGIAITIIGVSIGVKYSIDHQLISPLMRIILGYVFGIVLLLVGFKLKRNYKNFSAVLVSGAMAIMYFISYTAYSFYSLFPQSVAFAIMVVFTIFTVVMAIKFNLQLIAHIGLVGAYAVPFLLSDGSGRVTILFSYMSIINVGILTLAITKYWKPLYYVSFGLSWFILLSWFLSLTDSNKYFTITIAFAAIFFFTFYGISLVYKLIKKEKFDIGDVTIILINSFVFYYIVYTLWDANNLYTNYLGVFTFFNALVHLVVSITVYKQNLTDRNLFYMIFGLFIVFVTIAIPVQLDGNWVTLLWACEAALMFWIGRVKQVALYEKISYPLIILSFISISHDWLEYSFSDKAMPVFNIGFLSACIVIISLLVVIYLNYKYQPITTIARENAFIKFVNIIIPVVLFLVIYFALRMEINKYWTTEYLNSAIKLPESVNNFEELKHDENIIRYNDIWLLNYTLLFFAGLITVNNKKFKNQLFGMSGIVLGAVGIYFFMTYGLYVFRVLRSNFIQQTDVDLYQLSAWSIAVKYLSMLFVALLLAVMYKAVKLKIYNTYTTIRLSIVYDCFFAVVILWLLSSEVVAWLQWNGNPHQYKMGLSILWGIFALIVAGFGIWKKKSHLRWGSIGLFGVTIVKVLIYDISDLNSISKTIIMVSLGLLLLVFSFLYNKYKTDINN